MMIVAAEAVPIRIPLKKPFTIALGTLTHTNHVLVRMVDDEGRVGWGETTTFHSVYGYDQKSLYNVLADHLIPAVLGLDPRDRVALHQQMEMAIPFNTMAKTGVDLATYDLAAQAADLPIHALVGGARVDRIPVVGVVDIVPPPQAEEMALKIVANGHRVIKVKIGLDARQDLERVKAVRKAVGDGIRIRVDGNQGYDRATAMWVFSRMEEVGLEWIEQPLPHWDLEGLRALCQRFDTPVAVDESVHSPEDAAQVIRAGAADVVNVKVTKCGGIDRSQKIAAICSAAGVPCYLGGCLETHTGVAASAHFYAATPNIVSAAEIRAESAYVDDVVAVPLTEEDGDLVLPKGPGLGVVVDEQKVALYRASF
ncbi:MAG TPA: enolase C-terminal domain-like protein [Desulfobacterales bacterium]|nr:enolase C-terminal domain-like protein [Desulfobacterales bacterium]